MFPDIGRGTLLVLGVVGAYFWIMLAVAYWADRRADLGRSVVRHPTVYALSLAAYCTAWTFYGSVGRAAETGVGFLTTYIGPTLIALLWGSLLVKMVRVSKAQRITSIADFVASRYGKSQLLAGLVTVIAVVGVIPYIALQLKAIAWSFSIVAGNPELRIAQQADAPFWQGADLILALLLAATAILFGTRHLDASERHEGMVAVVTLHSVLKLVVFLAVGIWISLGLIGLGGPTIPPAPSDPRLAALLSPHIGPMTDWFAMSLLAAFGVVLLPRQFQLGVVECSDERHIRRAIWLFPLYLLVINLFVIPIAVAGLRTFASGQANPDTFVLTLPLAFDEPWLALAVFLGGLSAAVDMVIVETIALSTMVCNDLVLPVLLRRLDRANLKDMRGLLLAIRRLAIVAIVLLGYIYYRLAGEAYALVAIGLISFTAMAQFAPAVIGALYWRGGTREGALAGLAAGFLVWIYTLLLPSFARSGWLPPMFIESGIFGIDVLKPQALFGFSGWNQIVHSLFWSLAANLGAFLLVSSLRSPNAAEAAQASAYVDALKHGRRPPALPIWRGSAEVAELIRLAERFVGVQGARRSFHAFAHDRGLEKIEDLPADARTVDFAETLLSGAIGRASARAMVSTIASEEPVGLDEVLSILDEASQIRAYSRELEKKSRELEAASAELRAANARLQELDRLKDDFMSSVTHELRTPLASIRAFSEILYDDPEIPLEERKRFLGILVSETERLSRLVNQVLDLAKIESGHASWRNERVDLREVIEQAVATTGRLIADRGARLTLDLEGAPSGPVLVCADRDRLVQVLVNLLSNAAKFAPAEDGRVEVRLAAEDGAYLVCVADNGPGIPESDLDLVFEKFRQSASGGEKPLGTGLGLPISRQIVENFGGRIWAESGPGIGATLCFRLPALEATTSP